MTTVIDDSSLHIPYTEEDKKHDAEVLLKRKLLSGVKDALDKKKKKE